MEPNSLECGICNERFSEERCPRILLCSHTFCGLCINEIISTKSKTCPFCRKEFSARSAEELTFNRSLLDVAKHLSSLTIESRNSCRTPQGSFVDFKEGLRANFTKKVITDCKEARCQVLYAASALTAINNEVKRARKGIVNLKDTLDEIILSNEDLQGIFQENFLLLTKNLRALGDEDSKIKEIDAKLEAATDFISTGTIMEEFKDDLYNTQGKVMEVRQTLDENERKKDALLKEFIKMQTSLRNVADEIEKTIEVDFHRVYAVKPFEGEQRAGLIQIGSKNKVFMSHLEEEVIPKASWIGTIKLASLMPKTSRMVFLDVGADGKFLGRITIKVIDEGNLALNFLHLCTGDLGPSYAKSQIFGVGRKGKGGENVGFGDYLVEDGTSAKSVLSRVDWLKESQRDLYKETATRAGDVRGWFSEEPIHSGVSRFYIVVKDDPSWKPRYRFGVVEEGLDVLENILFRYPENKIEIIDCGLVFSL